MGGVASSLGFPHDMLHFFFQEEDGIRVRNVTGVQTCALPISFCYVDKQKAYHGGIIAPGIKISMDALYSKASKLPKIEIEAPAQIVGQSTVEAMQAGVYYGYVSQVDGIVRRMKEEVGTNPKVIATGGFAQLIAKGSETIEHVEKHLTLKGLYEIYQYHEIEGKE